MANSNLILEYALNILFEAGHATSLSPVYVNHSINRVMYSDSTDFVVLSSLERDVIKFVEDISLLIVLDKNVFSESSDTISFYAATLSLSKSNRSEGACMIHKIIHRHTGMRYSIVFFQNDDQYVISMADTKGSIYLSDWFSINDDPINMIEKINIANTSLLSAHSFFYDFLWAVGRSYYFETMSLDYAMYVVYPEEMQVLDNMGIAIKESRDQIKKHVREVMFLAQKKYADDYIEPYPVLYSLENEKENVDISAEIDRMSFELELAEEEFEQSGFIATAPEFDDEVDETPYDDYDYDDMPPEVFADPVKMVKWLEAKEAESKNTAETIEDDFDGISTFFLDKGFDVIDKREKGGCLWVVGSKNELKRYVDFLRETYGIEGYYGSGKATNHQPGWYTTSPY